MPCWEVFTETVLDRVESLSSEAPSDGFDSCRFQVGGLTTTYNWLKDETVTEAAVQSLRPLHEAVDRALLDAYGWSDVQVPPYGGATAAQREAFEDDVLDRLFDLNERRAREEAYRSAATAPAKKSRSKKTA